MRKYSLLACFMSMFFLTLQSTAQADDCATFCDEWSVGSGKFKVGADWLYWQVNQDNLDVARIVRYNEETGEKHCRPVSQNQKWNSGYRVNLGYEFCDCWDLGLYYTDLPTRTSSRHHHLEGSDTFYGIAEGFAFSEQLDLPGINSLHAKWRSELSWLDFDLSRAVCFGECLTIRPHIGFRVLWNNKKFHIHGTIANPITVGDQVIEDPYFAAHLKDDTTGYGTEGGVWGNWEMGCGLSVVGHVGGSILYTQHKTHQSSANAYYSQLSVVEGGGQQTTELSIDPVLCKHSHFFGVPTMDYFIGLKYESTFCDFILSTTIGWEQHIFFDINRISRNRGNLSAQGLTWNFEAAF
jgi:hypothetical protein